MGRSKTENPVCRICKVKLIPGENCTPGGFGRGEYICRVHKRERDRAGYKKRRSAKPEYYKKKTQEYRLKYPHIELKHRLKSKFNISVEDYNNLLTIQNHSCAICGRHQKELKRQLSVDHCHTTGQIRGLLCTSCNSSIGILGDTAEALLKVVDYLNKEHFIPRSKE